jgi:hypothetical protein
MASTISTTCPKCKKIFNVLAELQGKKIRCKECGNIFRVQGANGKPDDGKKQKVAGSSAGAAGKGAAKEATAPATGAKPRPMDDDEDSTPIGLTTVEIVPRCPVCANEMESATAIICLHCGFNTRTRETQKTKRVADITTRDLVKWQLPGYICAFAIFFFIGFWVFFHFALPHIIFGDKWNETLELADVDGSRRKAAGHDKLGESAFWSYLFHPGCEWWLDMALAGATVYCGYFAYKRCIRNRRPPERVLHS